MSYIIPNLLIYFVKIYNIFTKQRKVPGRGGDRPGLRRLRRRSARRLRRALRAGGGGLRRAARRELVVDRSRNCSRSARKARERRPSSCQSLPCRNTGLPLCSLPCPRHRLPPQLLRGPEQHSSFLSR